MSKKKQLVRAELKKAEERKRALLYRKKRMQKLMVISVILICIIGIVTVMSILKSPNEFDKNSEPTQSSDIISETEIGIQFSDIDDNAKFYSYNADGIEVKYFAVRDLDGGIHVAFDACDVCYEAKKGYKQNIDVMKCLNCGKVFPIISIGTENTAGGCWPSYLPIKIDNGQVIIEKSDLALKKWMF